MSAVLVAYATRHGSTHEVAESIAATLRGCGDDVDAVPAGQVRDPITGGANAIAGLAAKNTPALKD
jgi:menaquinone-dependent protoporphyrinogen IX oxidase